MLLNLSASFNKQNNCDAKCWIEYKDKPQVILRVTTSKIGNRSVVFLALYPDGGYFGFRWDWQGYMDEKWWSGHIEYFEEKLREIFTSLEMNQAPVKKWPRIKGKIRHLKDGENSLPLLQKIIEEMIGFRISDSSTL